MRHGEFTGLEKNYSKYRPAYSETILTALLGMIDKDVSDINVADVGAGTGIWTRMIAKRNVKTVVAVEPNDAMREQGIKDSGGLNIKWIKGDGEKTNLDSNSCDLLTMASSFHWVDLNQGLKEFSRVLNDNGKFCALWNPRLIEVNPLLLEIENKLSEFSKDIKRVSSGRSGTTEKLIDELNSSPYFSDAVYMEARHIEKQTPEHYLGVWWSVNDIRVQLGEDNFKKFMDYVEERVKDLECIEATYLTRAFSADIKVCT